MEYEFAVFDNHGQQMGMPARAFPDNLAAKTFRKSLEQARARAIAEGQASETLLHDGSDYSSQKREEFEDSVTKGKRAASTSYSTKVREVGPWQPTTL